MTPQLSVVVAAVGERPALEPTLRAIAEACEGFTVEVLVVGAARAGSTGSSPSYRLVEAREDDLVPVRWGRGVAECSAPLIAFTSTEFLVGRGWARKLLGALAGDVAGIAGTIGLPPGAGMTDTAMYLLRFSSFAPVGVASSGTVRDIPGDNAIYRAEDIRRHPDLLDGGFWEVEFHRRFEGEGRRLLLVPDQLAEFSASASLVVRALQRFRHGRQFGATRVINRGESWWRILLASPLVPLVMVQRITQRIGRSSYGLRLVLKSAPALLLLAGAWASGEAVGGLATRWRRSGEA